MLEQQFFQVGEYKVGEVLDRPVEEGIVEDVALDEAETDVDRIEEDDDDPEDEGGHQEAESDAEQFVEPAEHRHLEKLGQEFRQEQGPDGDADQHDGEGDHVQEGFRYFQIRLDPPADQFRETEGRPDADKQADQADGLLEEALGKAPDDGREETDEEDDIQRVHSLESIVKMRIFADCKIRQKI